MLFGYINEVVKDHAVTEQYVVDLFNELQTKDLEEILAPGANAFCRLQQLARKKIASFVTTVENCGDPEKATSHKTIKGNKFIDSMGKDQQAVFCGIHYHGKTTATLAGELNKPEATIRQLLKESFIIIRNNPQ